MLTDYNFNEPSLPNREILKDVSDEKNFDQYALGNKSTRNLYNKEFPDERRELLAFVVTFLQEIQHKYVIFYVCQYKRDKLELTKRN